MMKYSSRAIVALFIVWVTAAAAFAETNLRSLIPFGKRVEADPEQTYELTDEHGPWMILAASFSGADAQQQAHQLVLELRRRFNVEAYVHRRSFDFSEPVIGIGLDKFGAPRKMRHRKSIKVNEIAVLVGNFNSSDEQSAEKVLDKIKHARPQCLDLSQLKTTSQSLAFMREVQRRLSPDPKKREMGPMRTAFITRNPLLPQEYFVPQGLDALVVEMNEDVEFSLLDCPGRFTVRVATFRGESTMRLDEMSEDDPIKLSLRREPTKLELAAEKAHRLTMALREKGMEAYEFHDRFESIVTVGSFQSVGSPRVDGKTEIDPAVHAIMDTFKARRRDLPGGFGAVVGLEPLVVKGIACDVQPVPVEVPQIGRDKLSIR
jgi:hypothetical protein